MIPEFAYGRLTYNTFMTNMNSLTLWTVVWRKRESNPRLWLMRPACYLYTTALGRALSQPRPCSLYYRASSSNFVASTLPRVRHFRTQTEPSVIDRLIKVLKASAFRKNHSWPKPCPWFFRGSIDYGIRLPA